ncbi:polymer-forming cytoskeletal protein [Collimonas sp.]|jgi:predicted acyltransferase (DUF342 family)|uniref:polymer-forming cytoskeletal protein n=1 Tax=Collimonas sp. TaxID=1963772 RepID=UPI002CA4E5A9|nr:polymer-forming cytoskeletal protein [Collimonas sp.]HWW06769.1 polymer-forming cytoskeletal protein [Collimonas sp.]
MAFPALLLICVFLIALLPYIPATYEWLRPTDVAPLPVRRNEINNLRYFADSFRQRITAIPEINLSGLRNLQTDRTVSSNDNLNIVHQRLGADASASYYPETLKMLQKKNVIVIFVHDARLPPGSHNQADLFAASDLSVGAGASLRACSAQGVITLGANTVVHRWIDAPCIHVGSNASIDGRITALKEINFADGSQFVRAGAPSMRFGACDAASAAAEALPEMSPSWATRTRQILDDGAEASSDIYQNGDFVVRGAYRVLAGTTLFGSIKTYGDLYLGQHSRIVGSIVSNKDIVLAKGCSVLGPVISQNDIVIGADCRIGAPGAATTVICRKLTIAAGCVVHGVITTQDGATVTTVTTAEIPDAA